MKWLVPFLFLCTRRCQKWFSGMDGKNLTILTEMCCWKQIIVTQSQPETCLHHPVSITQPWIWLVPATLYKRYNKHFTAIMNSWNVFLYLVISVLIKKNTRYDPQWKCTHSEMSYLKIIFKILLIGGLTGWGCTSQAEGQIKFFFSSPLSSPKVSHSLFRWALCPSSPTRTK